MIKEHCKKEKKEPNSRQRINLKEHFKRMDIQSGTFWFDRANPNSLGMQSIAWQDLDCKTREFQP